jgi:hypothetical protein
MSATMPRASIAQRMLENRRLRLSSTVSDVEFMGWVSHPLHGIGNLKPIRTNPRYTEEVAKDGAGSEMPNLAGFAAISEI